MHFKYKLCFYRLSIIAKKKNRYTIWFIIATTVSIIKEIEKVTIGSRDAFLKLGDF